MAKKKTMKLFKGRKGPGVGYLKSSKPKKIDGDRDAVVVERRPKKGRKYPLARKTKNSV